MVLAPVGDDLAQLRLEAEGADAGAAHVQMAGDLHPPRLGELAVEVEVEPLDGLVAVEESGRQRPVQGDCRIRWCLLISHCGTPLPGLVRGPDQAPLASTLDQRLLERLSSAMDAAHHRSDGHVGDPVSYTHLR